MRSFRGCIKSLDTRYFNYLSSLVTPLSRTLTGRELPSHLSVVSEIPCYTATYYLPSSKMAPISDGTAAVKAYIDDNRDKINGYLETLVTNFEEFKVFLSTNKAYIVVILSEDCVTSDPEDFDMEVELALSMVEPFPEDPDTTLSDLVSYLIVKKNNSTWWGYEWISRPEWTLMGDAEFCLS